MNAARLTSKEIIHAARNGRLAANYYGFTCDWCWRKGMMGGWHDNRSSETSYIRAFSESGAEIRICTGCAKKLRKRHWLCCLN